MANEMTLTIDTNRLSKMAGWTGLEPATFVVTSLRPSLRHLFSGSSVALFSPFSICCHMGLIEACQTCLGVKPASQLNVSRKMPAEPSRIVLTVCHFWPTTLP